jgi:fatty acid/phospholipid biosynthesis enzyme
MQGVIQEGAALHAADVSITASIGEHSLTRAESGAMNVALEQARKQHATIVASSGNTGGVLVGSWRLRRAGMDLSARPL